MVDLPPRLRQEGRIDISKDEKTALKKIAKVYLDMTEKQFQAAIEAGELTEACADDETDEGEDLQE